MYGVEIALWIINKYLLKLHAKFSLYELFIFKNHEIIAILS